jgi:hypothetical protein
MSPFLYLHTPEKEKGAERYFQKHGGFHMANAAMLLQLLTRTLLASSLLW